jgi:hypothetical protein
MLKTMRSMRNVIPRIEPAFEAELNFRQRVGEVTGSGDGVMKLAEEFEDWEGENAWSVVGSERTLFQLDELAAGELESVSSWEKVDE